MFLVSQLLSQEQLQNNEANRLLLQQLKDLALQLKFIYDTHPISLTVSFCLVFFITTIMYIPFTGSFFVLFAGLIFGLTKGIILYSFLVSISYTASFLISRHILHNFIRKRMGPRSKAVVKGFEEDGVVYLLSLRFSGVVPAVVVNTALSITDVRILPYYLTTQIGTLPHVIALIYAGSQLEQLQDINRLVPAKFFLIIFILAMMPIVLRIISDYILKKKKNFG